MKERRSISLNQALSTSSCPTEKSLSERNYRWQVNVLRVCIFKSEALYKPKPGTVYFESSNRKISFRKNYLSDSDLLKGVVIKSHSLTEIKKCVATKDTLWPKGLKVHIDDIYNFFFLHPVIRRASQNFGPVVHVFNKHLSSSSSLFQHSCCKTCLILYTKIFWWFLEKKSSWGIWIYSYI